MSAIMAITIIACVYFITCTIEEFIKDKRK